MIAEPYGIAMPSQDLRGVHFPQLSCLSLPSPLMDVQRRPIGKPRRQPIGAIPALPDQGFGGRTGWRSGDERQQE
jgi:hypothetical protein